MAVKETKEQREERMKRNAEVLKRYNLDVKQKPIPITKPEGKVLSMADMLKKRICSGCHTGNMQEMNFGKDINKWKCSICGNTITVDKG